MNGLKKIIALCILCLLAVSVVAAQSASAAGITGFTCTESAVTKDFASAHCVPGETGTKFGHVAIGGTETEGRASNANTNSTTTGPLNGILKETIAATNLELQATGITGEGKGFNREVGGVMEGTGTGTASFTGVTVTAPAGKGCKVFEDVEGTKTEGTEGVVRTRSLTGRTVVNGAKHEGILEPAAGTVFATFFITCEKGKGVPEALEGTWEFTGSVKCPVSGATAVCSHSEVTTQNTLKGKGAKAGIEGKVTGTARADSTQPFTPISGTTTP